MDNSNNNQNFEYNQKIKDKTNREIEKMRLAVSDSERCREIARKLCAYISSSSNK